MIIAARCRDLLRRCAPSLPRCRAVHCPVRQFIPSPGGTVPRRRGGVNAPTSARRRATCSSWRRRLACRCRWKHVPGDGDHSGVGQRALSLRWLRRSSILPATPCAPYGAAVASDFGAVRTISRFHLVSPSAFSRCGVGMRMAWGDVLLVQRTCHRVRDDFEVKPRIGGSDCVWSGVGLLQNRASACIG